MIMHGYLIFNLISFLNFVALFGALHTARVGGSYRYMVELYKRYRSEQTNAQETISTAVRSILPTRDKTEWGEEVLVYNLTSVPTSEVIIKAELHIYIRSKKSKGNEYLLKLWAENPTSPSSLPLEERRIRQEGGWGVYNVLEAALSCKRQRDKNQQFLGVSLQKSGDRKKSHHFQTRRLLGSNPQPFLVIFSEHKLIHPRATSTFDSGLKGLASLVNSRRKRSVRDNNLPEYPIYQFDGMPVTLTSSRYEKHSRPLQEGSSAGSKKQGDRKDKRRHRRLPFLRAKLNTPDENDATISEEMGVGICQKKKFVVEFEDIGWSQYIIAPDNFAPGYCSGQCTLQLTKSISWSNHATLQSLVHALKLDPDVPPPCCVPDVTSSLSLLYFGERNTIIFKKYSNMVVESCACR